ncbi:hypothetical protein [Thiocapsa marina]|uniref:Uncharacterized protein n=1 Tax=Thiocapsa marina 5811 TaxID=768671 RepID=F9UDH8_9GAMM|nr:hypothetical protein [Thiocapsa marina]EGV17922.1 hypothetical protein ThimaDRAFT_2981 [Thiocapsa marina 5811]
MRAIAPLILLLGTLVLGSGDLAAETEGPAAASSQSEPDVWNRTLETASDWWQRSRDFADQAVADAKGLFADDQDFARVWGTVVPTLDSTLELEERHGELPEKTWFGTDQRSNREEINALLDTAVEILSTSPVQNYRERIRILQAEIEKDRAEIADARQKRIAAPAESTLKKTVADYDRLIASLEDDIDRRNGELAAVKREFADELHGMGLDLGDDQLELLLSTVVGDNMIDLGILFDNVKAVTAQLEVLVAQSGEDLQSARRYYGLYVVLLQALNRMHLQIEEAIGEQYIPQIDAIIARAQELSGETRRLQRESPGRRDVLAANLEAQQLTVQAAEIYRRYLREQATQVKQARRELEKDIAAAWNTYETVRVSGELVSLVRSSQQLLDGLMNRQVPTLRPFENLEMQREFQKLTEQLRNRSAG